MAHREGSSRDICQCIMSLLHFLVCVDILILSPLHVASTYPCNTSRCVLSPLLQFFSEISHAAMKKYFSWRKALTTRAWGISDLSLQYSCIFSTISLLCSYNILTVVWRTQIIKLYHNNSKYYALILGTWQKCNRYEISFKAHLRKNVPTRKADTTQAPLSRN